MDLPAVAGRRTTSYSLLSQFPDDTYQLQLALALRLCADAASAADPAFLDPGHSATATTGPFPLPPPTPSADSLSHRFWVNGSLSYSNTIPDGFYLIHGMDPFVWSLCTDLLEENRIPSIESLKSVRPDDSSIQAILIDRRTDFDLGMLENYASSFLSSSADMKDVINQLAKLVSSRMGGTTSNEESFLPRWKECSDAIKSSTGSIVLHLGKLPIGFCKHRSLLFKMLADKVNVPCRVVKGCKYCKSDDATSCLVRFGLEREYLVDLIGDPGQLSDPDSFVNGPYSLSVPSPLRPPKFRSLEITSNFSSVAKQYFSDCHSLNLLFNEASTGATSNAAVAMDQPYSTRKHDTRDDIMSSWVPVKGQAAVSSDAILPEAPREVLPLITSSNLKADKKKEFKLIEGNQYLRSTVSDLSLAVDDLIIPWNELILKEKIGAGSFGTVHRADWNGSDVAVKILMEQDFHPDRFREFMREVAIMKSLRHPNIVLFMGAVTEPPNLSIVTEYLSRSGAKEVLDERRRLNMAFDVAKGMNYLHKRSPPIVHRDLKSPNLLVDKKYTVKVCDFGLSRLKANTFLSSKSLAGTPEWMAPEVLRDEPSNEKSDVYSFGVILWELMTMQQPWCNLNPAQVVAAVGFKGRRLDIPKDLNPQVAALIESCWANTGHPIEVSFWTAPPPRVSHMCVHCPGLDPYKFATEPTIMATEADLVLVRVTIGPRGNCFNTKCSDLFMYQATTPTPSLRLIPHPAAICSFFDREVGLLRCCGSVAYIVAALCNTFQSGYLEYALHIYRAGADAWTSHPLSLHGLVDPTSFTHVNTNTITVGGEAGTMAWVDLHRAILFCDLLPCPHTPLLLRYFPLPPPLRLSAHTKLTGCPRFSRDIALVQGRFNFTQMRIHVKPGSITNGTYISQGWTLATWSAPATNPWKQGWRQDCNLSASDLSVDANTMNFQLLPKLSDHQQGTPQQTLERLHVGHPTLSLQSNDIVCLMAKVDQWDDHAWVLAVDMKNRRLKDVAQFGAERTLGISLAYIISSKISEYLRTAPGIKGNLKRQGVVFTVHSHKKQTRMVHLSTPSWKGGDQQNSGTSMDDGEDNMDLDLDIFFF
uniref:non-specific serine/threonine protein kinase n=1 Tax=Oryza barthii TaxID=65489 RepID=A0A0D3HA62_9ORYZ